MAGTILHLFLSTIDLIAEDAYNSCVFTSRSNEHLSAAQILARGRTKEVITVGNTVFWRTIFQEQTHILIVERCQVCGGIDPNNNGPQMLY